MISGLEVRKGERFEATEELPSPRTSPFLLKIEEKFFGADFGLVHRCIFRRRINSIEPLLCVEHRSSLLRQTLLNIMTTFTQVCSYFLLLIISLSCVSGCFLNSCPYRRYGRNVRCSTCGKNNDGICATVGHCCTHDECFADTKCTPNAVCPEKYCKIGHLTAFCLASAFCCTSEICLQSLQCA
ncbi:unnamed protein product, partial [Mesorhabditis belari]|uniref:Uncharacterized protein n=1 Tax=Mesorhabditis belari TaxID=2138241 RepID=A0AAF3ERN2_9BILA